MIRDGATDVVKIATPLRIWQGGCFFYGRSIRRYDVRVFSACLIQVFLLWCLMRLSYRNARPDWALSGIAALIIALMLFAMPGLVLSASDATAAGAAQSADKTAKVNLAETLDAARSLVDKVQKRIGDQAAALPSDAELQEMRAAVQDVQSKAESLAATIDPQLASVRARLAELGAPPESAETRDVHAQRTQLEKNQATLDSQLKLARLLVVESGQLAEQIIKLRRSRFQAQLGERSSSPLAPAFWADLAYDWPRDATRLSSLADDLMAFWQAIPGWSVAAMALATFVVFGMRAWVRRRLVHIAATHVAPGRLRRSLHAVTVVLLAVAAPTLIAWAWRAISLGSVPDDAASDTVRTLLYWMVGAVAFGGLVTGVSRALLQPTHASWRLLFIPDEVASALRWMPSTMGVLIVVCWMMVTVAILTNLGLAASVAVDCSVTLVLSVALFMALMQGRRARKRWARASEEGVGQLLPFWWTGLLAIVWIFLVVGMVATFAGFVPLGSFLIRQLIWSILILSIAYLLAVLVKDACNVLLYLIERNAQASNAMPSATRIRSQAVVLLSGAGRVAIYALALVTLLVPFGEGPEDWLRRVTQLYEGIPVGEMNIRPTSVLMALGVLVFGMGMVKGLKRWFADSYLPTTSLDAGMRVSTATLFGYIGYVVVVASAMTAVGIGLERVAWVASALSVGIGFGLQAVVQNFVSGLILLAERPVKVGDWVSLGGLEGDIRRINVRATEIQMGDRSTVIVPNSEFITKIVRNVTLANPLGRVQFSLSLPVSTDAERARDIMLAALQEEEGILDDPAPSVNFDRIDSSGMVFILTGYAGSPRVTGGIRSRLLFSIVARLREAGLPLVTPASISFVGDAPSVPSIAASAGPGAEPPTAS